MQRVDRGYLRAPGHLLTPIGGRLYQGSPNVTRRCTTVRNSDYQALPLRWAPTPICICSLSASASSTASAHQQHRCIGYMHRKRYLPIYVKSGHISLYPLTPPEMLQTPPDMLQTPPDTIRHGPDTNRYHQTCIMYGLYGLKHHIVEISGDVTDAGRDKPMNDKKRQGYSAFDL